MNPFTTDAGGAPYPPSTYARSALPGPQEGGAPAQAAMPTVVRKHIVIIATIFIVGALLLFRWHYERD